jgi:hypothetical protein
VRGTSDLIAGENGRKNLCKAEAKPNHGRDIGFFVSPLCLFPLSNRGFVSTALWPSHG